MEGPKQEKVTYKSTKDKIWAAYKASQNMLQEKGEVTMDVENKKIDDNNTLVLENVESNGGLSVEHLIKILGTFEIKTVETQAKYQNLCEAISIKEKELTDLFGIEKNATSLAALLDAHESITENIKKEKEDILSSYQEKIEDRQTALKHAENALNSQITKKQNEFEYEFNREKIKRRDELGDELELIRKEKQRVLDVLAEQLAGKQKDYAERVSEFNKEKKEFDSLKEQIINFEATLEADREDTVKKTLSNCHKRFEAEKKYYILEKDGEVKTALAQLEAANAIIADAKAKNDKLESKLDSAYKELKDLASDTVKGAANSDMFDKMKGLVETGKTSK